VQAKEYQKSASRKYIYFVLIVLVVVGAVLGIVFATR